MSEFLNNNHFPVAVVASVLCNGWVLYVSFLAYMENLRAQMAAANARLKAEVIIDELIKTENNGVSESDNAENT